MTPSELKKKMERIRKLFDKAEDILNSIPKELHEPLENYHVDHYGILHCIRWGLSGSEELRDNAKKIIKEAKKEGYI